MGRVGLRPEAAGQVGSGKWRQRSDIAGASQFQRHLSLGVEMFLGL